MPFYEYQCEACVVVYETMHGMTASGPDSCPKCRGSLTRLMSMPQINRYNYTSPTEAKYARMTPREEIAREQKLQQVYERIWLPPPVAHSPWD